MLTLHLFGPDLDEFGDFFTEGRGLTNRGENVTSDGPASSIWSRSSKVAASFRTQLVTIVKNYGAKSLPRSLRRAALVR